MSWQPWWKRKPVILPAPLEPAELMAQVATHPTMTGPPPEGARTASGEPPIQALPNVDPKAPRPASRRERKQANPKQRIAELEETVHILGLALLTMRTELEGYLGKPVARNILPRG